MNITKEYLLEILHYEDGKLYWKKDSNNQVRIGSEAGSNHKATGYRNIVINKKSYRLHRIIFLMHHGYLPEFVDHINNNKLDNRIKNLRPATRYQNCQNTRTKKSNTSGIKGVYWNKRLNKWECSLDQNGKRVYIGVFDNIELAELVISEARKKYHGQFANYY